jgi:hypothetical protein
MSREKGYSFVLFEVGVGEDRTAAFFPRDEPRCEDDITLSLGRWA